MKIEGTVVITDTDQFAGSGNYEITDKGKLMVGEVEYISSADNAVINIDGTVNVNSVNGGYTFDIPKEVKANINKKNSSGDYYHHGAKDVFNVYGELTININFANHGTINITDGSALKIAEEYKVFASPSNNTGTIILGEGSTIDGTVVGTNAPTNEAGTYKWDGTNSNWVK